MQSTALADFLKLSLLILTMSPWSRRQIFTKDGNEFCESSYWVLDIVLSDTKRGNKIPSVLSSLWKRQKENKTMIFRSYGWVSGNGSIEHRVHHWTTEPFMNQSIPSFSCNDPKMHLRFSWTCAFVSGHSIMFHQSSFLFVAISNRLDDANLLISLNI